jgi:hypothetical protein
METAGGSAILEFKAKAGLLSDFLKTDLRAGKRGECENRKRGPGRGPEAV